MSSKFIPKKNNLIGYEKVNWFSNGWANEPSKEEKRLQKQAEREHTLKKSRLRKIPIEDITFKDVWTLPLNMLEYGDHIYDKDGHMVAQFDWDVKDDDQKKILNIINTGDSGIRDNLKHESGDIFIHQNGQWLPFITIRGWGGLTGTGGYELSSEKAVKIQDSFAEYIIKKLTDGIIR